jgi:hypothetical protein
MCNYYLIKFRKLTYNCKHIKRLSDTILKSPSSLLFKNQIINCLCSQKLYNRVIALIESGRELSEKVIKFIKTGSLTFFKKRTEFRPSFRNILCLY